MTRRAQPEAAIQRAVVAQLRARAKRDVLWFHVPNGGKRNRIEAARFKALGMLAGVSDIILVYRGCVFGLELKADGGRPTEAQLAFLSALADAGGFGCVAEGLDRAIAVLEQWNLLR